MKERKVEVRDLNKGEPEVSASFSELRMLQRRPSACFPLLIIPIIMARYENVINNTEDIVVAISHMVVGLRSVTISPLASTYVCQRRAAMTSSSSAHLVLPHWGWGLQGMLGNSSRLLA